MKALKYIIATSFLIVVFKFLLALNATTNGSYHASQASRMVPFLLILALAAALYPVLFVIRRVFPKRATRATSAMSAARGASRESEVAEVAASAPPQDAAQVSLRQARVEAPDDRASAPQADAGTLIQRGETAVGGPDNTMLRFFPNHPGKAASTPAAWPEEAGPAGTPTAPGNTMHRIFPQHADRAVAVPADDGALVETQRALNPVPLISPAAGPDIQDPHAVADEMRVELGSQNHAGRADLAEPSTGATSDVDAREQKKQALQLRQEIRHLDRTEGVAQRAAGLGRLRWLVAAPLGLLGTLFLIAGSDGGSLLLGGFGGLMLVPAVLKGCGVK